MATAISISSKEMFGFLESKGFKREENAGYEVVYSFVHKKNPNVKVKVFTSLSDGASESRGCGEDAIRVVTVLIHFDENIIF